MADTGSWLVVVYSTEAEAKDAQKVLPGLLPEGASGTGRTSILPGGGRISVVDSSVPPFGGQGYTAIFLDWKEGTEQQFTGMAAWRAASRRNITAVG